MMISRSEFLGVDMLECAARAFLDQDSIARDLQVRALVHAKHGGKR